eukprot:TRINITY_DN12990_c0_g1_i1.p1 TRINITY_DN12990_c0_g1~~TRINITY_DN12990_c0_g1_i1.p1  ORF type:complete len:591 (-),score=36.96 TRINITY_DN12990_c0_g1_i1:111-1883(-)
MDTGNGIATSSSCEAENSAPRGRGMWYKVVGIDGTITATTCVTGTSPDSAAVVEATAGGCFFAQRCVQSNTMRACNIPNMRVASTIIFESEEGEVYWIHVFSELHENTGPISFLVSAKPRTHAPGELCTSALDSGPVNSLGIQLNENTEQNTLYRPHLSCTGQMAIGVWYRVVGTGGLLRATTCHRFTRFEAVIDLYQECPSAATHATCLSSVPMECQKEQLTYLEAVTSVGQEYYILVRGRDVYQYGQFVLTLSSPPLAENANCDHARKLLTLPAISFRESTRGALPRPHPVDCQQVKGVWLQIQGDEQRLQLSDCNHPTAGGLLAVLFHTSEVCTTSCGTVRAIASAQRQCSAPVSLKVHHTAAKAYGTIYEWPTTPGQMYHLFLYSDLTGVDFDIEVGTCPHGGCDPPASSSTTSGLAIITIASTTTGVGSTTLAATTFVSSTTTTGSANNAIITTTSAATTLYATTTDATSLPPSVYHTKVSAEFASTISTSTGSTAPYFAPDPKSGMFASSTTGSGSTVASPPSTTSLDQQHDIVVSNTEVEDLAPDLGMELVWYGLMLILLPIGFWRTGAYRLCCPPSSSPATT